ncbi:MAG: hypothetical protein ACXWBN_19525 [Acidimicrobiales bacterium]
MPTGSSPRPRGPLGWLFTVAAVLVTLLTLAYGVVFIVNVLAIRTYHSTTTFPLTDTLVLKGGDSRITLVADATDEIVVDATVRRGLVDARSVATMDGDELVLDGGCRSPFASFCSVTLTVHVPRHLSLRGGISDGSLTADGLIGPVSLSVADGRVDLANMDADTVDLAVVDGRVDLGLVSSPQSIRVRTADGRASVCLPEAAPAYAVTEHEADGAVRVDVPDDPRSSRPMDLSTADGSISVAFCR